MAKAPVAAKNKKGKDLAEYPKIIKIGPHVRGERGVHTAPKVTVQNAEEEAEVRKKYNLDKPKSAGNSWY